MPSLIETIRIRNGAAPLWYLHLRRLAASCKALGIPLPGELMTPEGRRRPGPPAGGGAARAAGQRAAGREHRPGRARGLATVTHQSYPYKTTERAQFDRALEEARAAGADDALCSRPAGTWRSARSGVCSGGRTAGSAPRRSSWACCRAWPGPGSTELTGGLVEGGLQLGGAGGPEPLRGERRARGGAGGDRSSGETVPQDPGTARRFAASFWP